MKKRIAPADQTDSPQRTPCGRIPGTPLAKVSHELTALALSHGLRPADACRRSGALDPNGSSFEPNARRLCQRPDIRERRDEFTKLRARDFERLLQQCHLMDDPACHAIPHPKHGEPDLVQAYHDAEGRVVGYVCRWNRPMPEGNQSKEILPVTYCELGGGKRGWRSKGIPAPTQSVPRVPHVPPQKDDAENEEDRQMAFEERAAILEYDAGLPRSEAEALARRWITACSK